MARSVHVSVELKSSIAEHIKNTRNETGIKLTEGQVLDQVWRYYSQGIEQKLELDDSATSALRRIEQRLEHLMDVESARASD